MRIATLFVVSAMALGLGACSDSSGFGGGGGKKSGASEKPQAKKPVKNKSDDEVQANAGEERDPETDLGQQEAEEDLPLDEPSDDVLANVDTSCSGGSGGFGGFGGGVAPKLPAMPKTVPADCRHGIELNNVYNSSFDLQATKASGSRSLKMEVDIASYLAPDRMRILAHTANGEKLLVDTCRLSTANYTDPTDGSRRPPEDSIREFRVTLPKGTTSLTFDFSEADSPTYMKVTGLCDFTLSQAGQLRSF